MVNSRRFENSASGSQFNPLAWLSRFFEARRQERALAILREALEVIEEEEPICPAGADRWGGRTFYINGRRHVTAAR